ncbi:hypothetical protein PGT21_027616 [Puccinia graminis f. sp. tritici]|uniref:Uncharacterized protein n=1 Tax=Puccinia graminis f. sp. tritici TaxID=56615 RepID=A0A5B0MFW6_PUCGR|nr:hypothetical protein PGT21_027616 [Puccinia graminis f. sp. tritici]
MFGLIPAKLEPQALSRNSRFPRDGPSLRLQDSKSYPVQYLSHGQPRYFVLARAYFLPLPPTRCLFRATRRFL